MTTILYRFKAGFAVRITEHTGEHYPFRVYVENHPTPNVEERTLEEAIEYVRNTFPLELL